MQPYKIGFSRQGEMDYPIQYEIVYSDSSQNAMWKWIKLNPNDFWRSRSNEPLTDDELIEFVEKKKQAHNIKQIHLLRDKIRESDIISCFKPKTNNTFEM